MSGGAPEYMLQISAVQLKSLLNTACKVLDNACTFLLGHRVDLLSDGCLSYSNGAGLLGLMLRNPQRNKFGAFKSGEWGVHSSSGLRLMWCSTNLLRSHTIVKLAVWGRNHTLHQRPHHTLHQRPHYTLYQRPQYQEGTTLCINVLTLLELSSELLKHRTGTLFSHCHRVISIIFEEKWSNGAMLRDGDLWLVLFWMKRGSNDPVRFLAFPKRLVLGVNMTIYKEVGFIKKSECVKQKEVLGSSVAKIWTDSWNLVSFLAVRIVIGDPDSKNWLSHDLHKCYESQSSWSTWKSYSCLEMCWNGTSFSIMLELSWKTLFPNMSSHKRSSAPSSKKLFRSAWLNISKW